MGLSSWLVAGLVPSLTRQPRKRLDPPDPKALLALLDRWRDEAVKAGRDGFWLARWLRLRGIEAHVIHSTRPSRTLSHCFATGEGELR